MESGEVECARGECNVFRAVDVVLVCAWDLLVVDIVRGVDAEVDVDVEVPAEVVCVA